YYESMYDDAENLNVTYPPGLTPDEQLVYETDAAKSLAEVATLVARSLYLQAGGEENNLNNITADPKILDSPCVCHFRGKMHSLDVCLILLLNAGRVAAQQDGGVCYILDGILIVYGIVLTILYCRLKVTLHQDI
ncbi:hypothetical protein cypCar_00009657, partial [Cyprinus carpio]